MAGLAVAALIAGAVGSWVYNSGYRSRLARDSAIVVTGTDLSAFVDRPSSSHTISFPVSNYSPYAVTVEQVTLNDAPGVTWGGANTVIQPGQTVYLTVTTPADCPVTAVPVPTPTQATKVALRVRTVNGKLHPINLGYFGGALEYAVKECGTVPSASATP